MQADRVDRDQNARAKFSNNRALAHLSQRLGFQGLMRCSSGFVTGWAGAVLGRQLYVACPLEKSAAKNVVS